MPETDTPSIPNPAGDQPPARTTAPWGVAPIAVAPPEPSEGDTPRRRNWRVRRTVEAAVVCGAMVLAPMTATGSRARVESDRYPATPETAWDVGVADELSRTGMVPHEPEADGAAGSLAGPGLVASFQDVELRAPTPRTELIGFHESLNEGAPELVPRGEIEADLNPRPEPRPGPGDVDDSVPALVLPPRDRPGSPSSAMDIAVPEGTPVTAPVTGTVRMASPYTLYGKYPDTRVEIEPDGRPDLRVVVIHVSDVGVTPGQRVVAGETPLAGSATKFPFTSQIDRFAAERTGRPESAHPHVHVELLRVA